MAKLTYNQFVTYTNQHPGIIKTGLIDFQKIKRNYTLLGIRDLEKYSRLDIFKQQGNGLSFESKLILLAEQYASDCSEKIVFRNMPIKYLLPYSKTNYTYNKKFFTDIEPGDQKCVWAKIWGYRFVDAIVLDYTKNKTFIDEKKFTLEQVYKNNDIWMLGDHYGFQHLVANNNDTDEFKKSGRERLGYSWNKCNNFTLLSELSLSNLQIRVIKLLADSRYRYTEGNRWKLVNNGSYDYDHSKKYNWPRIAQ